MVEFTYGKKFLIRRLEKLEKFVKESLFLASIPNARQNLIEQNFSHFQQMYLVTHYINHRFSFKRDRIHVRKEISYEAFKEARIVKS